MGNVNWGEVIQEAQSGGASFGLIPDGDYDFVVTAVEVKTTQNGKTMYVLENTIQGGPSANRKVWENLIVSPENGRAMGFFFRKTAALGYPVEWFQANSPTDDVVAQAFKGRPFRGKVTTQAGNGQYKDKNQISEWYAPLGAPASPSTPVAPSYAPPAPVAAPVAAPPVAAPAPVAAPPVPVAAPAPFPAPVAPPVPVAAPAPVAAPPVVPAGVPVPAATPWATAAGGPPAPNAPF